MGKKPCPGDLILVGRTYHRGEEKGKLSGIRKAAMNGVELGAHLEGTEGA